jgi:hypothetical protein
LKWLDEEEEKLKRNATESILVMDTSILPGKTSATIDLNKEKVLTYEDYYNIDDFLVDSGDKNKARPGKIPYEEFVSKMASENIFENDVSMAAFHLRLAFGATV